jgi:hypothetical protein
VSRRGALADSIGIRFLRSSSVYSEPADFDAHSYKPPRRRDSARPAAAPPGRCVPPIEQDSPICRPAPRNCTRIRGGGAPATIPIFQTRNRRSRAPREAYSPCFQQLASLQPSAALDSPDILESETGRLRKAAAVKRSALRALLRAAGDRRQRRWLRCPAGYRHRPNA